MKRKSGAWLRPQSYISSVPGQSRITWKPEEGARKQALRARDAMQMPQASLFLGHKVPTDPGSISDLSSRFKESLSLSCNPQPPVATSLSLNVLSVKWEPLPCHGGKIFPLPS